MHSRCRGMPSAQRSNMSRNRSELRDQTQRLLDGPLKHVKGAALARYGVRAEHRRPLDVLLPAVGFLVCGYLWISLRTPAKIAGGAWLAAGVVYGAIKTRGFRRHVVSFDLPAE